MKITKILLLFVSISMIWGCNDAIDIAPADEIVESNAITSVSEAGEAVLGVYATATNTNPIYWNALFTDELVISPGNNGQGIQTHTWSINSGNGESAGIYNSFSVTINRANRVLKAMESLTPDGPEEEEELAGYKAQMLALRGWAHFSMATYFTTSFTDMDALAVPYVDYVVVLETPNRNTWGELLAGVKSDLDEAEALFPSSTNSVFFMSPDAITALRARIALYTQDYTEAVAQSTKLINKYTLPSISEYPLIWTDESMVGQIFKLARVVGDGAVGQLFNPSPQLTYFNPSTKILEAYQEGDVRTSVFFDDLNRIVKYPGTESEIGLNDVKIFRVSEQYLIRAEANLRKSSPDVAAAQADYNKLRRNRIAGYEDETFTTTSSSIDLVMLERYRELAYEGHRFLDLKRTNSALVRNPADCESLAADACSLEATSYLWALPIPQSEIFVNDEMQQNPGY